MPTYIAMLRGVNVGGHKAPMAQLKAMCEGLGCAEVRTFIQSGNVIFKSAKGTPGAIAQKIEKKFLSEFGFASPVVLRTPEEMKEAIGRNPFLREKGIDVKHLYVTFLAEKPAPAAVDKIAAMKGGVDGLQVVGREVYLHCPGGYGESKLNNNAIEKAAGVAATTRNWNTVNKLWEMANA